MSRGHAIRLASFIAGLAFCLSCVGGPVGSEQRSEQPVVTVEGDGACRTLTLDASGTPSGEVVTTDINPAEPVVGYLMRTPEVVWWHAPGAVTASGHVAFVADEGNGSYDFVADPNQKIRILGASPGMPDGDEQLHIRSVTLTWTVQFTSPAPSPVGIRIRISPFPDGGLNRCLSYSCDPETGPQICPPLPEGTLCTDSNVCNGVETCDGEGNCTAGTNVAQGTSCSDGNACNGDETCNASGVCLAGTAPTQQQMDDGFACSADSCDPERGIVVHEPIPGCVGATDLDGDGMLDDWEVDHGIDPFRANAYEDDDGDGYPNLFEYVYNTLPNDPVSVPTPTFVVDGAGGGTHTTVGDALNAVSGTAPIIIGIRPGVYTGAANRFTVAASKPKLLFIGMNGADKTIIEGTGTNDGWTFNNSSVVTSLTFRKFAAALTVSAAGKELRFVNLLVRENGPTSLASGLHVWEAGNVHVVGSTFVNNVGTATDGTQIWIWGSGTNATLTNTAVWGQTSGPHVGKQSNSTLTVNYSYVKGQNFTGPGNLPGTADPLFRSDVVHLRASSPLRAAGGTVRQSRIDFDGETRPSNAPDIGVDQFVDADGDALPDAWEIATAGDITTIAGAVDSDNDGLTNAEEYDLETKWDDPDTDNDGIKDGVEALVSRNPLVADADELTSDLNHDGLIDVIGVQVGYQPDQPDDDGDGISNEQEVLWCLNPLRADTDGDGIPDGTDVFPFDPLLSSFASNPTDVTPPVITLTSPVNADEQP